MMVCCFLKGKTYRLIGIIDIAQGPETAGEINSGGTVLDMVSRYRQSEAVFKKYDEGTGVCICCETPFFRL
jgi:hypothetical protein